MRVERCNGLFIIGWLCVLAGVYLLLGLGAALVTLAGMKLERRTFHHPESHEYYGVVQGRGRPAATVRTGPLMIDTRQMRVTVGGRLVELSPREWQVLEVLAFRVGEAVPQTELLDLVYPGERGFEKIRTVLWRLRAKIGKAGDLIVTVTGIGTLLRDVPAWAEGQKDGDAEAPVVADEAAGRPRGARDVRADGCGGDGA